MPFKDGPLKLKLSQELREGVELELCRRIKQAVADSENRDAQQAVWRDQIEGLGQSATNQKWQAACDLNDPMTLIAFLDSLSQLMQAMRAATPIAVEAFTKEDQAGADLIEDFCAIEASRQGLWKVFYDAAHNACRDVAVPIYAGWKWQERPERSVGYRLPGMAAVLSEEEKQEGEEYEEVPVTKMKVEAGYDIKVLNLVDFYTYPANAPSLEQASIVGHRFLVTEDDLIDGIEDWGYDREKVYNLIETAPEASAESDFKAEQDSSDGVDPASGKEGYYELFTIFTRLPRRIGQEETPGYLRHDDFIAVICPSRNAVLKLDFSPFPERPYFLGHILPRPGSIQGYSIPSLLEGLQAEANAQVRFNIDSMNIIMTPAMKVKESEAARLNKYKIFPGASIPVKDMNDFMPIEWDRTTGEGMAYLRYFEEKGQGIISAPGQGSLQPKVRRAAEVNAVQQQAGTKFGLYLLMFQFTVVAPLFERMVSLKAHFGDVDEEDGEEFTGSEGRSHKLTTKALRGKYQFIPAVTSLTMSPEVRTQTNDMLGEIVTGYIQAITTMQNLPLEYKKGLWHMTRKQLHDLGEHNPETYIGEEPQEAPAPAALPVSQTPGQGGPPPPPQNGFHPMGNGAGMNGATANG